MPPMGDASERLWQDKVVQIAKTCGWLTFHTVPHQVRPGIWKSDGPGFPDLVLAHPKHGVIFAELKTNTGRMTPQQVEWQNVITSSGHRFYCWRPSMEANIVDILTGTAVQSAPNN